MAATTAFVVPMYQAERTIARCLESIRAQTVTDLEVVVVDDGSTDTSPDIVAALARADPRIRLVRNPSNQGVARSLNVGLAATEAELVARLDADDEAAPTRLERQIELMRSSPEVAVCGSFVTLIGRTPRHDQVAEVPIHDDEIRAELRDSIHCPFYHPSVLFRRRMVLDAGGYRELFRNSEDYDLWFRLAGEGSFHNIPEPLTRYRLSPHGSTLARVREQRLYALLATNAAAEPDTDLADLWARLRSSVDEPAMASVVRKEQLHHATQLADLGHPGQALALLVRARDELGASAVPRFALGRTRRRLRTLLGAH